MQTKGLKRHLRETELENVITTNNLIDDKQSTEPFVNSLKGTKKRRLAILNKIVKKNRVKDPNTISIDVSHISKTFFIYIYKLYIFVDYRLNNLQLNFRILVKVKMKKMMKIKMMKKQINQKMMRKMRKRKMKISQNLLKKKQRTVYKVNVIKQVKKKNLRIM